MSHKKKHAQKIRGRKLSRTVYSLLKVLWRKNGRNSEIEGLLLKFLTE